MQKKTRKKLQQNNSMKIQISISLPVALVKRVDLLAKKENRNRSNFISSQLEVLSEKLQKKPKGKTL